MLTRKEPFLPAERVERAWCPSRAWSCSRLLCPPDWDSKPHPPAVPEVASIAAARVSGDYGGLEALALGCGVCGDDAYTHIYLSISSCHAGGFPLPTGAFTGEVYIPYFAQKCWNPFTPEACHHRNVLCPSRVMVPLSLPSRGTSSPLVRQPAARDAPYLPAVTASASPLPKGSPAWD